MPLRPLALALILVASATHGGCLSAAAGFGIGYAIDTANNGDSRQQPVAAGELGYGEPIRVHWAGQYRVHGTFVGLLRGGDDQLRALVLETQGGDALRQVPLTQLDRVERYVPRSTTARWAGLGLGVLIDIGIAIAAIESITFW